MGYTLYWEYEKYNENTPKTFDKEFFDEAKAILDANQDKLGNWCGEKIDKSPISDLAISMNGLGTKACETFLFFPGASATSRHFFCKTNRKDYTDVCQAILKLAYKHGVITRWSNDDGESEGVSE